MKIRVSIDRLVLRGVAPADRPYLIDALQSELSRILSNPQTRSQWAHAQHVPLLRLGRLPFTPGPAGSRMLGAGIARGIQRKLAP